MANDLGVQLNAILTEYSEKVQKVANKAIESISKDAVRKLKGTSPAESGEYARGWVVQLDRKGLAVGSTIYNKAKPGLTHLLEYGHAKVGGGRVPAKSHIKAVEEWANAELIREIEGTL